MYIVMVNAKKDNEDTSKGDEEEEMLYLHCTARKHC